MNISGIIVTTAPGRERSVVDEIDKMANIEVHDASKERTVVAVIETETPGDAAVIFRQVHDVDGVLNVALSCSYEVEEN